MNNMAWAVYALATTSVCLSLCTNCVVAVDVDVDLDAEGHSWKYEGR